jgi:hypothetical protein
MLYYRAMKSYDKVDVGFHVVSNPDTKWRLWGGFILQSLCPWGKLLDCNWLVGCVGPRASLDMEANSCPCWVSNLDRSARKNVLAASLQEMYV